MSFRRIGCQNQASSMSKGRFQICASVWNVQALDRATDQRRAETGSVDRLRCAKAGFAEANTLETAEEADVLEVAGDENANFTGMAAAP